MWKEIARPATPTEAVGSLRPLVAVEHVDARFGRPDAKATIDKQVPAEDFLIDVVPNLLGNLVKVEFIEQVLRVG